MAFGVLFFVPGICIFAASLSLMFATLQILSMGFYQLSRLYYCFANKQIHSKKGYPNYFFIIMFVMGGIGCINVLLALTAYRPLIFLSRCTYNDKAEFHRYAVSENGSIGYLNTSFARYWLLCSLLAYTIWDFITLSAYIWKIRSFTRYSSDINNADIIHKRIVRILYKITILTIFYQINVIIFSIIGTITGHISSQVVTDIVETFSFCMVVFTVNVSMYLMMEHNRKRYVKFLRVLHYYRIDWICYCCKGMVESQLKEHDGDIENKMIQQYRKDQVNLKIDNKNSNTAQETDSMFETCDESVKAMPSNRIRISVDTTVIN